MHTVWTLLSIVGTVFAVLGLGSLLRVWGWLSHAADEGLLKLTVRVLVPCYFLDRLLGNEAVLHPGDFWLPPVFGYLCVGLGVGACMGVARALQNPLKLHTPAQRRTFGVSTGMFNYGYLPYPIAEALYGDSTLAILVVFNLGVETALWTVSVFTLTGGLSAGWHKRLLQPPTIAILLALLLNTTGLYRHAPDMAAGFFQMLGNCAIPMGILLVGATIADQVMAVRTNLEPRVVAASCVMRLGLLPIGFLLAAAMLPDDMIHLRRVLALQAAMPTAMFSILLAKLYHGDPATAVRVTLGTTLVGLITLPVWLLVGSRLLSMQ